VLARDCWWKSRSATLQVTRLEVLQSQTRNLNGGVQLGAFVRCCLNNLACQSGVPSYVSNYLDREAIRRICWTCLRKRHHVCRLCNARSDPAPVGLKHTADYDAAMASRDQQLQACLSRTGLRSTIICCKSCFGDMHTRHFPPSQRKSAAKPVAVASQHVHDHDCIPSTLHNAKLGQSTISWSDAPGTCTRDLKLCTTRAGPHSFAEQLPLM
jgi:hypothetical protein